MSVYLDNWPPDQEVVIDYTNWRGERGERKIWPRRIRFEATEWHKGEQWLLEAIDVEKGELRLFAMKDIHSWSVVK